MHVGVDCIGLVMQVAEELKLLCTKNLVFSERDYLTYCYQADNDVLVSLLQDNLINISTDTYQVGDLLLLGHKKQKHVGFVGEVNGKKTLIHACMKRKKVVEHRIIKSLHDNILKAYKFSNVYEGR